MKLIPVKLRIPDYAIAIPPLISISIGFVLLAILK